MPAQRHVFTSESVTEGHPDKIADQISDAVLDAIIAKDATARVACETLVTTGMAVVAGEITTTTYVHIPDIVRGAISAIGYTDASFGFDAQTCAILTTIDRQSGDIALGVRSEEHTSELQSQSNLVCRLLLEKKKKKQLSSIRQHRNQQRDSVHPPHSKLTVS